MVVPKNKHFIFVYGTLRPGNTATARLSGQMYDLGFYPGIRLGGKGCNSSFVAEVIEADDARLARIDNYEGYHENDHVTSLYLRRPISAVIGGKTVQGWIYEYNYPKDLEKAKFIEHGDWLQYKRQKEGSRTDLVVVPGPKPREAIVDGERAAK